MRFISLLVVLVHAYNSYNTILLEPKLPKKKKSGTVELYFLINSNQKLIRSETLVSIKKLNKNSPTYV